MRAIVLDRGRKTRGGGGGGEEGRGGKVER